MDKKELDYVISKHKEWINGDGGEYASLSNEDLRGVSLSGANLSHADLSGADLSDADLSDADLRDANLKYANLRDADLKYADLTDADLRGANLRDTNLRGASLSHADLRDADLSNANLKYADLSNADLTGANLRDTNLDYSCLPLWCGSLEAHFDDKQLVQIAYHLVKAGLQIKNASEETKTELSKLIDFANKFHRVGECGEIKKESMKND